MDVLQSLIRDLAREPELDLATLQNLVESREWQPGRLAGMLESVPMDHLSYRRRVVHADDRCEVVLVHLPPGAETPIHDHDQSIGYVHVVSGMVINRIYRKSVLGTIELADERFIPKDTGCPMEFGLIHAMQNPSHVDAYSVHVYTPPYGKARFYEELPEYIASYI